MPKIVVTTYALTAEQRSELALALTQTACRLADAPPEKVEVFFQEMTPAPATIAVHAVAHQSDMEGWRAAFLSNLDQGYDISVYLYEPDHTAKAGVLRQPRSDG